MTEEEKRIISAYIGDILVADEMGDFNTLYDTALKILLRDQISGMPSPLMSARIRPGDLESGPETVVLEVQTRVPLWW